MDGINKVVKESDVISMGLKALNLCLIKFKLNPYKKVAQITARIGLKSPLIAEFFPNKI